MNQTKKHTTGKKLLALLLALIMSVSLLPMSVFAAEMGAETPIAEGQTQQDAVLDESGGQDEEVVPQEPVAEDPAPVEEDTTEDAAEDGIATFSTTAVDGYDYSIVHIDNGRKYFSVESINSIIDSAAAAGMHYVQLALGNDGLRFLLNDMSLTVNGKTYSHEAVSNAIHTGNENYHNFDVDELTERDMLAIMNHANAKGVQIIPLINTPGHMDAILYAATSLTGVTCSYSGSARTIDVTNTTAVAFTKALLQKYIDYFAGKGCKLFNMGADEYANDKFSTGGMGFGNLQFTGKYGYYVTYVNDVAGMIKSAGMTPMAFNDGIYYGSTDAYSFDKNILVCYWSPGWSGYEVAPASYLTSQGLSLINTHGGWYWIVGGSQVTAAKAAQFNYKTFNNNQNVSDPVGAMFCIWSDSPGAETDTSVAANVANVITNFGSTLPETDVPSQHVNLVEGETGGDTDPATKEENITLTVGQTSTEYTQDSDVTGKVNTDGYDSTVASYTAEYKKVEGKTEKALGTKQTSFTTTGTSGVISDGTNYMVIGSNGQISSTTDINAATEFTVTKYSHYNGYYVYYTIQGNGYYLTVTRSGNWYDGYTYALETEQSASNWDYSSTQGFDDSNYSRYLTYSNGWTVTNSANSAVGLHTVTTNTTKPVDATVITFTGKKVGTTSITIGNVKYNITVVAEDLTNVDPLTVQYWITNSRLTGATDKVNQISIKATDNKVATAGGVEIAKLVDTNGAKDGRTQEYWQSKILDVTKSNNSTSGTELQTTKSGDDETLNGVAFTKVRYYGGKWQVYTTEWIDVDRTQTTVTYAGDNNTGTQTYTGDKNQLVAYYMEVVDIKNANGTNNLHVNAADWGTKGDATGSWGYTPESDRCSVSIQLVYEDDSRNPADTTAASLKSKTIVYGYWSDGRGLGTMIFSGQENYQIYKVTAETGDMISTTGSGNTVTVTSFDWDGNEETVWQGDPTASVSIGNPAKNPTYDAPYDNLTWNTGSYNKNNAILIRVYVKSVAKADSLHVNYYVEGSTTPFYTYPINVKENTVFDPLFERVNATTLIHNEVEDYEGTTRTVQWDLKQMPQVAAQYRYSQYTFARAERSADGKTVNLYYTFDSTKTFVVDFGLPMVIKPTDMNANLATATITGVEIDRNTTYAKITTDEQFNITYTLNQTIDGEDNFGAKYSGRITTDTGAQTGEVEYAIKVIPASTVYYEDSFAKFYGSDGVEQTRFEQTTDSDTMGTWYVDGAAQNSTPTQALEELGKKQNVYGYDSAYTQNNSTTFSMGSAKKVTVDATKFVYDPTVKFTFKGTGFDVISLTDNNSGAIVVNVERKDTNTTGYEAYNKNFLVNNYYGYSYNKTTHEWTVDNSAENNALYQIPVMKVTGLPYGEYAVTITVGYGEFFDKTNDGKYSFWMDAIRVYDPMGKDYDYKNGDDTDNESYPQYIKLRNALAKDDGSVTTNSQLLFIDGAKNAEITLYKNYGPNNEVYLMKDQAISFKAPANTDIASIQIGAKAPLAKDGSATLTVVNGATLGKDKVTSINIGTATEMYYELNDAKGQIVTITNKGDSILSLTNLKITFTAKQTDNVVLASFTTLEQTETVEVVRALFAAPVEPEPDPEPETFEPDRFDVSWNRSTVKVGQKATLTVKTSEDVDAITVDGVTFTNYCTRTQREGWGWNAKKVTYREFTYTVTAAEAGTLDVSVAAVNAEGVSSAAVTATLTVQAASQRPGIGGWLDNIFGRWF